DRLLQSPNIHATVAVRPHFGRQNIVSDGHTQSFELHLLFGFLIASENRFDRARGTCDRVLQPFEKGTQESSHRLGIFRRKLRIHDDRIAIEFEAMVTHQHHNNVVHRYAAIFKRKIGGERKSGDGIDLAVGKDRLARRKSDVQDRHLSDVDPRRLNKDGPLGKSGIPSRRTELFSFQVFRHRYAATLARDDGAGGFAVDHEYRFERGTSISVTELDKRVDIAEAYVVGARGDAINRFNRTVSRLDRHVESFRSEISTVYRNQKGCGRSFELPIKCEFNRGLRAGRTFHQCCREQPEDDAPVATAENMDNAHVSNPSLPDFSKIGVPPTRVASG